MSGLLATVKATLRRGYDRSICMGWTEYIRGKSVAIVGPAVPEYDQSEEIDSKDVVIRLRWMGEPHHDWYGKRCDVSFYNLAASRNLLETGNINHIIRDLDWVLTKAEYGLTDVTESRMVNKPHGVNANQVPIILHDLSYFEPGPVYVYGADFYWNPEKAYLSLYEKDSSDIKPQLKGTTVTERIKHHNWNLQRGICKKSWENLDLRGDKRFIDVLRLTDEEYVRGMRTSYPDLLDDEG